MYQFGEVVLLEYPYTDLVGVKLRPAVVLKDTNDSDFIIVRATSQSRQTEYDIKIEDWQSAGLLKPSIIPLFSDVPQSGHQEQKIKSRL